MNDEVKALSPEEEQKRLEKIMEEMANQPKQVENVQEEKI